MQGEVSFYCPDCKMKLKLVFRDGMTYHKCLECGYEIVNNYHVAVELQAEYLETINMILSAKEIITGKYKQIKPLERSKNAQEN